MSDPVSVVIIVTVIVSLNAGSASATASYPPTFFVFLATTFAPMSWVLVASGTTTGFVLSAFAVVTSLLDISKLDAGVVTPNPEPVSVSVLFRQLSSEFLPLAGQKGNTLSIRTNRAWVHSDPGMLQRILRNLLGNALRYTSNGRVLLAARRRGDKLRLEVRDTGVGITEDRFDDIFMEFQQLSNPQRDHRLAEEQTGLDAVSNLRRAVGVEVPALVVTGDTVPERIREARSSGYPLLHKPVQPARLRSAMLHLLRNRA